MFKMKFKIFFKFTLKLKLWIITIILFGLINIICCTATIVPDESGPLSEIQTAVGLETTLPCDLLPSSNVMLVDKVQLVIWYKEGNDQPIYSFDSRGKTLQQAIHWSDKNVLKLKAHFYYDSDPPALKIKNILRDDAGLYRCRVDFQKSPTRNSRINLTVLIPPTKLTILDDQGAAVLDHILGPYNEGASINVTCISSGGVPPPRVSWWREHALLDDSFQILPDGSVKNILHLSKINRRDLHTVFTCQASNGHVVPPLSNTVKLEMKQTIDKKELFVCPVSWFQGNENNGIVQYPSDTKQFLKYQGVQGKMPKSSWCSESARMLAKYSEYQLAVKGMHRLEDGATSEEGRLDTKQYRKLNALRNMSNDPTTVQELIDNTKKSMEKTLNATVELPSFPTGTNKLGDTSSNSTTGHNQLPRVTSLVIDHNIDDDGFQIQLSETEDDTANQNNIIIELPEITNRLDKIESNIKEVILTMSNIDKKINKIIEAIANMGTLMTTPGTSQLPKPVGTISCFSSLLPIKDDHVFNEFETMLRNKNYYQQFVTEMAAYGGTSGDKKGDKIAYGLIDQIFTRQFLTQCSWTGSSKSQATKVSFSSAMTFLDAFYDIVHLADSRYSKSDAKEFFKEKILRNANSRLLSLQQKDAEEPTKNRRRTTKALVTETVNTTAVTQTTVTLTSELTNIPEPQQIITATVIEQ